MTPATVDTKAQILKSATRLFSQKGFNQTSVREISKEAGVNVASINYHFRSKSDLMWEIFLLGYERIENLTSTAAKNHPDFEGFIQALMSAYLDESDSVRNIFRFFISDPPPEFDKKLASFIVSRGSGVPGEPTIAETFKAAAPNPISPAKLQWAIRSLFSSMIHWTIMFNTSLFEQKRKMHPESFDRQTFIRDATQLAKSISNHLSKF